jgi:hypothetical protein
MPAKEIKQLRQEGKFEEALNMAKAELQADPSNIWAKRNISWVYYDYLKQNSLPEQFDSFMTWLDELKNLQLPADEKMLFEQLCWQIGKMAFNLLKIVPVDTNKGIKLFETIHSFHFPAPSDGYSFLFKALHKFLKDTDKYIQFADWWDFKYFMPNNFEKDKLPNGKEIMSIVEQAYITYAKHILPKRTFTGEIIFDREKANAFLPLLSELCDKNPAMQYPPYFHAKLLLATGDKNDALAKLLPFARKKRNDFWVWDILAELFTNDPEKVFSCYCRALSCKSPEEMLTKLRQKFSAILVERKLFNEAKTEIEQLLKTKKEQGHSVSAELLNWISSEWYKEAKTLNNNFSLYKNNGHVAEEILFADIPATTVFVEFVNSDKKMLNFITKDYKRGFFKYDRLIAQVEIADILSVRFRNNVIEDLNQVYSATKIIDKDFEAHFIKDLEGEVKMGEGKNFGFIGDIFIHPSFVTKYKLENGQNMIVKAIKSWNKEKKNWSWKAIELNPKK